MTKRKFRTFCNEGKCKEEFIVEIEDNSNAEQEAANALVKKFGEHLKQKHPKEWRNRMDIDCQINVIQGDKAAFLTEDGSIVEATAENISQGGEQMFTFKFKEDFKGFANMRPERKKKKNNVYDEEHQINSNNIPKGAVPTSPTTDPNPSNPSKGFNWKQPWVIATMSVTALALVGLVIYLVGRKKDNK